MNDRRSDKCQGCGAHGDKMYNREVCPAVGRDCFKRSTRGHFGQLCKKLPKPQSCHIQKMVRVAETHGGGADPTPMMRDASLSL